MDAAISHSAFLLTNFTAVINVDYMLCSLTPWSTLSFVQGYWTSLQQINCQVFVLYFRDGNCIKLAVTEASLLFHLWSDCPNAHSYFV